MVESVKERIIERYSHLTNNKRKFSEYVKKPLKQAFRINTIVKAVDTSSGFALIDGATDAIAVPPQTAVPEANKKESLSEIPISFPRKITKKCMMN